MVTNAARLSLAITVTLGTLAVATACGGDDAGGGGGQTGGTGGGLVTGGTGGGGGTPVTGGTGGADAGNGDGNDTMETASSLTLGTKTSAKLDPPGSDVDWYEFEGKAGQVVAISGVAKVFEGFDPAYPDLAITLYDANGTQIAEQDDPWPWYTTDPYLLTVLPSDGLYFLRVLECHAFNPGAQGCSDLNAIIITDYSLLVKELTFSDATEVKETEPNGDAATASSMTFKPDPNQPGQFYTTLLFGGFENESDVDVYGITTPTGVALHAGARPALVLAPQSAGIDGNGSSTSAGEIYVTTKADPADVLAKIDVPLGGRLFIPVTQGTEYLLFQKRVAAPTGSQDFYFDRAWVYSGNTLETDDAANDFHPTAQALPQFSPQQFYVEGDLLSAADVDHFSVPVDGEVIWVQCGAERLGSGLRGFTMAVLNADGSPVSGASLTETANEDAVLGPVPVPTGQTKLIIKFTAASQEADVSSKFYRCGIAFSSAP